ncbi:hypothetical protein Cgig2_029714 [Carnegiea gigantea]|uniref:Uncharacterized protein n=1 Tax=Carnegiea gigantea TaxID=171969 RepID=A0A9Q1GNZ3_9CARY|nr:hypothetical protein Cgig2_029714 [Carnegiea gigantea]
MEGVESIWQILDGLRGSGERWLVAVARWWLTGVGGGRSPPSKTEGTKPSTYKEEESRFRGSGESWLVVVARWWSTRVGGGRWSPPLLWGGVTHWAFIQELLKLFWSSDPVTTLCLCTKVNKLKDAMEHIYSKLQEMKGSVQADLQHQVSLVVQPMIEVSHFCL